VDHSLSWVRRTLAENGISAQKRWGQNYLINAGARRKIVGLLDAAPGERVWEVGPGLGALTDLLVPLGCGLVLFEIDWKLVRFLRSRYENEADVRIVAGDVLATWRSEAETRGRPAKIVGNLPYRSASALLASLAEEEAGAGRMVYTVQRELAERLTAEPGNKEYSAFSVLCRTAFHIRLHGDLQPGSFYPAPRVVSTIVELSPRPDAVHGRPGRLLSAVVRGLFENRRKTLRNNLMGGGRFRGWDRPALVAALEELGVDPRRRAETLDPAAFRRIAEAFAPFLPDRPA
jgi:16S rRNA (adenine1518-N6/adenine1519-N6)-dimethyltransferase